MSFRTFVAAAVLSLVGLKVAYAAPNDGPVKIGLLTDMSSVLADTSGAGSLAAVRLAIADFGGNVLGKPIEVVSADHQNKADVGRVHRAPMV